MRSSNMLVGMLHWDRVPARLSTWDGLELGSMDARTRLVLHRPAAVATLLAAPGELGLVRAYVNGDLDIDGDVRGLLETRAQIFRAIRWVHVPRTAALALKARRKAPPRPSIEFVARGRRRSRKRDRQAIGHHYELPSEFFELFLGPSMAYTCAVYEDDSMDLDDAQANKYDLICRKLQLASGDRLLDIGCGWGGLLIHAAKHYGVRGVGVTLSAEQRTYARRWSDESGVGDVVDIRLQDYRSLEGERFDAVSAVGVYEHIGLPRRGRNFFHDVHRLLHGDGRFLLHAITARAGDTARPSRNGFVHRYVFPDGEAVELGRTTTALQSAGFEVHNVESLRDHYPRTLRAWAERLEDNWDRAVDLVGEPAARVWRLFMPAYAHYLEATRVQHHQTLAVPIKAALSGFPLRPNWEAPLGVHGARIA
jgi:cyclopropane-fatty-acyl-phospholipid synthase